MSSVEKWNQERGSYKDKKFEPLLVSYDGAKRSRVVSVDNLKISLKLKKEIRQIIVDYSDLMEKADSECTACSNVLKYAKKNYKKTKKAAYTETGAYVRRQMQERNKAAQSIEKLFGKLWALDDDKWTTFLEEDGSTSDLDSFKRRLDRMNESATAALKYK